MRAEKRLCIVFRRSLNNRTIILRANGGALPDEQLSRHGLKGRKTKKIALGAIRTRALSLKRGVLYLLSYKRKFFIKFVKTIYFSITFSASRSYDHKSYIIKNKIYCQAFYFFILQVSLYDNKFFHFYLILLYQARFHQL